MSLQAIDLECVRNDRVLFSRLNFQVSAGMALQIDGPNGSGKTSLLRILCGLMRPEAGQLYWNGQALEALGAEYSHQVIYVGHKLGIKEDLTLRENLQFCQAFGRPYPVSAIDEALAYFNLSELSEGLARRLSAGQRQRLALARLRVVQAPLWILDEPFTALDYRGIARVEKLLSEHLQYEGMIVLTSHHTVKLPVGQVQRLSLESIDC